MKEYNTWRDENCNMHHAGNSTLCDGSNDPFGSMDGRKSCHRRRHGSRRSYGFFYIYSSNTYVAYDGVHANSSAFQSNGIIREVLEVINTKSDLTDENASEKNKLVTEGRVEFRDVCFQIL